MFKEGFCLGGGSQVFFFLKKKDKQEAIFRGGGSHRCIFAPIVFGFLKKYININV